MELNSLLKKLNKIIPKKYKLVETSNSGRDGYFKFSNLFGNKIIYVYFSPYKDIEVIKFHLLKKKHISYTKKFKIKGDSFLYEDAIKKLIINKDI